MLPWPTIFKLSKFDIAEIIFHLQSVFYHQKSNTKFNKVGLNNLLNTFHFFFHLESQHVELFISRIVPIYSKCLPLLRGWKTCFSINNPFLVIASIIYEIILLLENYYK